MGVSVTLENYLKTRNIGFDLLPHHYSEGSFNTALAARVPAHHFAKGVVFRDEDFHYVMAVIPANHRVLRHTLNNILDRHLEMAEEEELSDLFFDCEQGAIPSIGQAYGISIIWDDQLAQASDLWCEAGDHENLIHLNHDSFELLMNDQMHEVISRHRQTGNGKKPGT